MLRVNKWQLRRPQKLSCGHTAKQGEAAFAITLIVCESDVARSTEACVQALQTMRPEPWRPSFLYQLWHFLWGKKRQTKPASSVLSHASETKRPTPWGQSRRFRARQSMTLDCGHLVTAGEAYQFTSVYTCGQEGAWPRSVLLACFRLLQQSSAGQADRVPVSA